MLTDRRLRFAAARWPLREQTRSGMAGVFAGRAGSGSCRVTRGEAECQFPGDRLAGGVLSGRRRWGRRSPCLPSSSQVACARRLPVGGAYGKHAVMASARAGCSAGGTSRRRAARVRRQRLRRGHAAAHGDRLSWGDWDHAAWESVWIYRKHFAGPAVRRTRVFVDFDGVMTNATVVLNGGRAGAHQGGYLPWSAELTRPAGQRRQRAGGHRGCAVADVPPDGAPGGAGVRRLPAAGRHLPGRRAARRARGVPRRRVRPAGRTCSTAGRRRCRCRPRSTRPPCPRPGDGHRRAAGRHGRVAGARPTSSVTITGTGTTSSALSITGIGSVTLWSPDTPKLYTVRTTLHSVPAARPHTARRSGPASARRCSRTDGFYLNGERLQIFGLNRHQLFPYTGHGGARRGCSAGTPRSSSTS